MSHNASVTYAFSFIDKLLEAASEVSDAGEFDALRPKIQKLTVKGNLLFKGKGLSYLVCYTRYQKVLQPISLSSQL